MENLVGAEICIEREMTVVEPLLNCKAQYRHIQPCGKEVQFCLNQMTVFMGCFSFGFIKVY